MFCVFVAPFCFILCSFCDFAALRQSIPSTSWPMRIVLAAALVVSQLLWLGGACSVLFGVRTRDAAYLSTSTSVVHGGVTVVGAGFEWIRQVGGTLVGMRGDISDCEELFAALQARNAAHELDFSGRPLSAESIAHLCQSIVSKRLRTSQRLSANIMVAGWDEKSAGQQMLLSASPPSDGAGSPADSRGAGARGVEGEGEGEGGRPRLFWLDEIGALQEVERAAHGREAPFLLSLLDQIGREARTGAEAEAEAEADTRTAGGGHKSGGVSRRSLELEGGSADGDEEIGSERGHEKDGAERVTGAEVQGGQKRERAQQGELALLRQLGGCWAQVARRSRNRVDAGRGGRSLLTLRVSGQGCRALRLDLEGGDPPQKRSWS
jgi:20S proteasome alpha/beta subunit